MKQKQGSVSRRIIQAMDQEIRGRGHGAIRRADRAAGYGESWWQHRVKSGEIKVSQLLSLLDHLGLDPVAFMRRALGAEDGLELDRPHGTPPDIVVRAWQRLESGDEGDGLGETYLTTLDRRRYHKPKEVMEQALWAVDYVELALMPRLLGVAGSALRLLIKLAEAEQAIHAGLEIAQQRGDQATVANMLRRLAYVVADRGDRVEALRISERAALAHLRLGDRSGLAEATVDQGIWLHYLNRFEEANATHKSALDLLPEASARYRCTAYQNLGLNCRELGEPREALRYVREAESVAAAGEIEEWATSNLIWLRALVHVDLGELDQAETLLSVVVETFRELHHGKTALATCDLVRVHLLQKRPEDAYLTAMSMRALLEPLRHHKLISAAIGDLIRCGRASLTLALVESVKSRIEDERQRDQEMWQALKSRG